LGIGTYESAVCAHLQLSDVNQAIEAEEPMPSGLLSAIVLQYPLQQAHFTQTMPTSDCNHPVPSSSSSLRSLTSRLSQGLLGMSYILDDSVMSSHAWATLVSNSTASSKRQKTKFYRLIDESLCHEPLAFTLQLHRHSFELVQCVVTAIFRA
jgi:hypothetical protein